MEYVEKHPEKDWNWDGLSGNPFNGELPRLRRFATAVAKIEAWWVDVNWNPKWKRVRERLKGEWEGLQNE
jgi:hypothetical protein